MIDGWLTDEEGKILAELSKGKRVLEIGSFVGKSAYAMREAKLLVCADKFPTNVYYAEGNRWIPDTLREFRNNTKDIENLVILQINHKELRKVLNGQFDLIYIDGEHYAENIIQDFLYANYLQPQYIAIHDYKHPDFPDVEICVDILMKKLGYKKYKEVKGLLIISKR